MKKITTIIEGRKRGAGGMLQRYDSRGRYCTEQDYWKEHEREGRIRKLQKLLKKERDKRELEELESLLTPSQRNAVKRGMNVLRDHLTKDDLLAIDAESSGASILRPNQSGWNHLQEGEDSSLALEKSIGSLQKSLDNPYLNTKARNYLSEKLSVFEKMSQKLNRKVKKENEK